MGWREGAPTKRSEQEEHAEPAVVLDAGLPGDPQHRAHDGVPRLGWDEHGVPGMGEHGVPGMGEYGAPGMG